MASSRGTAEVEGQGIQSEHSASRSQAKAGAAGKTCGHDVAEALTALLSIPDPLGDETKEAIEEAFDELDGKLSAIGEVVGWDADIEGRPAAPAGERALARGPASDRGASRSRRAATVETRVD